MKLLFWETCVDCRQSTFQLLSYSNIFPTGALIQRVALISAVPFFPTSVLIWGSALIRLLRVIDVTKIDLKTAVFLFILMAGGQHL